MRFRQRLAGVAGAMVLVAGAAVVAVPASAAPAPVPMTTYKACANKDTGAIRLVVKGKKCTKNEIKLKWNAQGPAGIQGPVGPQGVPGPQGVAGQAGGPIPSGRTVIGEVFFWTAASVASTHVVSVTLPGDAGKLLGDADVNFAADGHAHTTDDDPTCTGTTTNPTAPPGKVCLYLKGHWEDSSSIQGFGHVETPAGRTTFFVSWWDSALDIAPTAGIDAIWAYTAP